MKKLSISKFAILNIFSSVLILFFFISITDAQEYKTVIEKSLSQMVNPIIKDKISSLNFSLNFNNSKPQSDDVKLVWQQQFASQLAPGQDVAKDIAVDKFDNIYITGNVSKLPYGVDILTIKYNPQGEEIWTKLFNGPADGDDIPETIAVDSIGNVYVFGSSFSDNRNQDLVIIKYNQDGFEQWVNYYDGPNNEDDYAVDMTLDNSGNIFLTGGCEFSKTPASVVIKYNPQGDEVWNTIYKEGTEFYNMFFEIVNDNVGNVYVTGIVSFHHNRDYITIKYNSIGVKQWESRYNGIGDGFDMSNAIALDDSGNVYVTGQSEELNSNFNCTTIKYDTSGTQQWVNHYNGFGNWLNSGIDLTINTFGIIYVLASSRTARGAAIKYNSIGQQLYIAELEGLAPKEITSDVNGDVRITGRTVNDNFFTARYNSRLQRQWISTYNGPADDYDEPYGNAVDNSGNIIVTGKSSSFSGRYSDYDFATVKYDASGNQQWVSRYNSNGNSDDTAKDVVVDSKGNVYMLGTSETSGTQEDFLVIKYDSSGSEQWKRRYDGPENYIDYPTALTVDLSGNIYVYGKSEGINTRSDFVAIKYNPEGIQQWLVRYNGPDNLSDIPVKLEVDRTGNVYLAGISLYTDSGRDIINIKYDSKGQKQWDVRFASPGDHSDRLGGFVMDDIGNIYLTGSALSSVPNPSSGPTNPADDFVTIKYNSEGILLWSAQYNGPANSTDHSHLIFVDHIGNVYVAGSSWDPVTFYDIVVIKYNPFGEQQWITRYSSPGQFSDSPKDMTLDTQGNIYVAGEDYTLLKFNNNGNSDWVNQYDYGEKYFSFNQIFLDDYNNLYVVGDADIISKYNSTGQLQWIYNCPSNIEKMTMDLRGNLFSVGSKRGYNWSIITTTKYRLNSPVFVIPQNFSLIQNYPNPFYYTTNIRYNVPKRGFVTLKVYNLLGQEVATLVNQTLETGKYDISWGGENVPSGVYLYHLKGEGFSDTKKLLLLK